MTQEELKRKCDEMGYVVKNNICLFQKGVLSQWYGGFSGQDDGSFELYSDDINFGSSSALDYLYEDTLIKFNCCEQWMMAGKALLFEDI